jgi:hypothetical protein
MTSWSEISQKVVRRAAGRCEYCRMHQSLQGATFHVEHIVPSSRGGKSDIENLAWACPGCNLHKSNRVEVTVPEDLEPIPLFHPRRDKWEEHFCWDDHRIVGLTRIGRATVEALQLNHERRVKIREAESLFNLFPPSDAEWPEQYGSE